MARELIEVAGEVYTYLTGEDADRAIEREIRIQRLVRTRGMSRRAAEIVVTRAMQ